MAFSHSIFFSFASNTTGGVINFKLHKSVTGKDSVVNKSYKMICFSINLIPGTFSQGLLLA